MLFDVSVFMSFFAYLSLQLGVSRVALLSIRPASIAHTNARNVVVVVVDAGDADAGVVIASCFESYFAMKNAYAMLFSAVLESSMSTTTKLACSLEY